MRRFREIRHARLHNQRVSSTTFTKPEQVVSWLGAVQAQDYPGAKWALALRLRGASHAIIERAFARGTILRTHVMRPTWHFVTPADIRWMLLLTAPRIRAATASYDRRLGIDAALINRSNKTIAGALAGGVHLTRQELKAALRAAGIAADSVQRLAHLVMHAELDAVICSGALRGKEFTYALLDDRVRATKALSRDEAIAKLTRRYFTSHGPAQMQDFVWWSGLKTADVRAGLEMCRRDLADELIDGKRYWFAPRQRQLVTPARSAYLLPTYDEYLIAYKDRSASLDKERWQTVVSRGLWSAPIIIDGRVIGGWRSALKNGQPTITLDLLSTLKRADQRLLDAASLRFAAFFELQLAPSRR
jgi:winged helix DNA-binding protein